MSATIPGTTARDAGAARRLVDAAIAAGGAVVRPAAGFLLFLLIVAALLQGLGRAGMWLLDEFEGSANTWLDGRARLDGLQGGWDAWNPVARVRRVELPAGWVEGVTVELDVLESVRRNRPVLQRLKVEDGELEIERTDAGWRLAGMEPVASDYDLGELLGDTDELRFTGRVAVAGAPESALALQFLGVNRDGAHAYDLSVGRAACAGDCRLEMRWRGRDRAWLGDPEERYLTVSGGLEVPGAFLAWLAPVTGLELRAQGGWLERDESGGGAFALSLKRVGLPGGVLGEINADLRGRLGDGRREGRLAAVTMTAGNAEFELAPVHFRSQPEGVELWVDKLPVGELAEFLTVALGGVETARNWIAATRPGGNLLNLHARVGTEGVGYAATIDDLRLDSYRGVPWVRDANGEIVGYERGVRLALNSEAMRVGIFDVFTDQWLWEYMRGNLHAWFGDGYVGMRAPYFKLETHGSRFSGSFSLARPAERMDQRVSMLIDADRLSVDQARTYIPYHLSEALRQWLEDGPRSGQLSGLRLAYQGQVHTRPEDRSRRLAVQARLSEGVVRYHSDWPPVTDAEGFIELAGSETHATVDFARTMAADIRDSTVLVGSGGAFARVALNAEVDTGAGLDFVRASPLAEWMTFVVPEWDGTGRLGLAGDLYIPIDESSAAPVDCHLEFSLADVGLVLPDYRLQVEHVNGAVNYRYPHYMDAEPLAAELFGRPATISAQADEDSVDLHFRGVAAEKDIYRLVDMSDPGLAYGTLPFAATLSIAVDDAITEMTVTSDLVGLDVDLPGEFAKAPEVLRPSRFDLKFLEEYVLVHFHHGALNGWIHVDEMPLRGAIGVRGPAPLVGPEADEVFVSGSVGLVDVIEWMAPDEATELPVPWRLTDVYVDRLQVETTVFDDLLLTGSSRDDTMTLEFAGADLTGRMLAAGEQPLDLYLQSVSLPEPDGEGDPLDVAMIDRLPDADVQIDSLTIGDEDFGNWSFTLRRRPEGVLAGDLHASLKGTEIAAPDGVFWHAGSNRSSGVVRLEMEDLAEVLPQWDFAPSLEAETASLDVDASWPGSPLNVEINGLRGDVALRAKNGSFLEVSGGGALRILSLLNFNTVLKRMSFNFKDVVAKGTSFDTIKANTRFDDGLLTFLEPAKVKGSGSDFKIGGSVNLVDGIMNDNEMIVTLPVSDSLPWYAVYISLANPAAAVAVLAGQQVLKKQIKQMSSAKYQISGSWDDPDVKLVGIWNDDVQDFDDLAQEQNTPGYPGEAATEGGL